MLAMLHLPLSQHSCSVSALLKQAKETKHAIKDSERPCSVTQSGKYIPDRIGYARQSHE